MLGSNKVNTVDGLALGSCPRFDLTDLFFVGVDHIIHNQRVSELFGYVGQVLWYFGFTIKSITDQLRF